MSLPLSVIVITRNEEHDLETCLASVKSVAGEIVVVDSGSTDRTLDIARRFTNKVFTNPWRGYSAQKQFALEKATKPWVLNIDADERITSPLRDEITQVVNGEAGAGLQAYDIPFHHYFLGKRLRFGGVAGETHVRLFMRELASYGNHDVHEKIRVKGKIGALKNPIDHQSYRSIEDYLQKCNEYTSVIARQKWESGKHFYFWHHLRLPFEFVVRYILKLGFLDGGPGLTYALLSSYYAWLKFVKIRDFEEKS